MKPKQILAILAIIALVGMYGITIIFAIFDDPKTMSFLTASLAMTALVPALLWIIRIFINLSSPPENKDHHTEDQTDQRNS